MMLRRRAIYNAGELPIGYKKLKYLESSSKQAINTGVIGNQDTAFTITFRQINYVNTWRQIFGARKDSSKEGNWIMVGAANGARGVRGSFGEFGSTTSGIGPTTAYLGIGAYDFNWHTVSCKKFTFLVDNVKHYTVPNHDNFSTTFPIHIFAFCDGGVVTQYIDVCVASLQLSSGGIITRDFIPALRLKDRKPGMYDSVTDDFFVNVGDGEFGYELMNGTYIAPI